MSAEPNGIQFRRNRLPQWCLDGGTCLVTGGWTTALTA
jgi:hypothetical protein